ncbi:MAG: hypothetical protein ACO1O6_01780 [Bacteroidota bacterium]
MDLVEQGMLKIYQNLQTQKKYGQESDYEIRVDGMIVIPRTNKLEYFEDLKLYLRPDSLLVQVRVYKGNSRVFDEYDLKTLYGFKCQEVESNRLQASEFGNQVISLSSEKNSLSFENYKLKQKKRRLKKKVQRLEIEVTELKKSTSISTAISSLGENLIPMIAAKEGEIAKPGLDGVNEKNLLGLYKHFEAELSTEEFEALISVLVNLGTNKALIIPTNEQIKKQILEQGSDSNNTPAQETNA